MFTNEITPPPPHPSPTPILKILLTLICFFRQEYHIVVINNLNNFTSFTASIPIVC